MMSDRYFQNEKSKIPYKDSGENLADYMTLAQILTDMAMLWRQECDEEEAVTPRGIRISPDYKKSAAILKDVASEDINAPILVPEIRESIREGLSFIASREAATEKQHKKDKSFCTDTLRIKNIIDAFSLSKRQTLLLVLLLAARNDIHILEAFSYIAAEESILEKGAPTAGLLDMLLHLVFEYEVIQAEVISDKSSTFSKYLANVSDEETNPLQKRVSVSDWVNKYILFGEGAFSVKPQKSTPGTSLYYDAFAKTLVPDAGKGKSKKTEKKNGFCYIRTKDAEDVIHILTKLSEEKDIPLYVIASEKVRRNQTGLFFVLNMMHHIHSAKVVVKIEEGENREADGKANSDAKATLSSILHTLKRELPSMGVIYLIGTENLPEVDVRGYDMPAILSLEPPDVNMRLSMWTELFQEYSLTPGDDVELLDIADCHDLSFGQIRTVVERCAANVRLTTSEPYVVKKELLQETLFSLSSVDFEHLATQVEARYTWDDIFLDESQKTNLKYACDRFRLKNRIGAEWEITKKNAYGNAVIVLMYGPPGTGKTMAAQVVANEVMTPLYRVDVSQIFSKYIGETQKNISRIFDEAQKRNVVLFFDEADALFTRRTQIKDSHDKYANSDTSFLLQKVEEYSGITILATNNAKSFDPAFMRRLTYVIRFERPDEDTRKAMWHSMMPPKVPLASDVDLDWFAVKFDEFSGSNIKSIIMTACFMAAADGKKLTMRHLVQAARLEFEKIGKLVDAGVFEQYAGYLME